MLAGARKGEVYKRGGSNRGGGQQGSATQLTHFPLTSVNAWGACLKWELWCPPHPASHPSAFKVEQVCESGNKIMCRISRKYEHGWTGIFFFCHGLGPFGVDLQKLLLAEPLTKFTTVFKVENLSALNEKYLPIKHVWIAQTDLLGDWTRFRRLCPRFEIGSWGDGDLYLGDRLPWKRAQMIIEQGAFVFWGYLG